MSRFKRPLTPHDPPPGTKCSFCKRVPTDQGVTRIIQGFATAVPAFICNLCIKRCAKLLATGLRGVIRYSPG